MTTLDDIANAPEAQLRGLVRALCAGDDVLLQRAVQFLSGRPHNGTPTNIDTKKRKSPPENDDDEAATASKQGDAKRPMIDSPEPTYQSVTNGNENLEPWLQCVYCEGDYRESENHDEACRSHYGNLYDATDQDQEEGEEEKPGSPPPTPPPVAGGYDSGDERQNVWIPRIERFECCGEKWGAEPCLVGRHRERDNGDWDIGPARWRGG